LAAIRGVINRANIAAAMDNLLVIFELLILRVSSIYELSGKPVMGLSDHFLAGTIDLFIFLPCARSSGG
jgi:hypothetical protein